MNNVFLKIEGTYICPKCGKTYDLKEEFSGDLGLFDSGSTIECECGVDFVLSVDLDEWDLESEEL